MEELLRYEFLKAWVKYAPIDEIVEKLILLDERTKELNSLKGGLKNGRIKKTNKYFN